MNIGLLTQLKDKKFWWLDIVFYFVISMLVATLLCYLIFIVKNNIQGKQIEEETAKIEAVATDLQKLDESKVILYQQKIRDFSGLLKNHQFASQVFIFIENQTLPNIWFERVGLEQGANKLQLSGEADNMDALSRQVDSFEKNEYVEKIDLLSSNLEEAGRIKFNLSLALNPEIFNYAQESQNDEASSSLNTPLFSDPNQL